MLYSGIDIEYDDMLEEVAKYYHCSINDIISITDYNDSLLEVEFFAPMGSYKDLVSKSILK